MLADVSEQAGGRPFGLERESLSSVFSSEFNPVFLRFLQ